MEERTIVPQKYQGFKHINQAKSNTVAAATKECWLKIADSVNEYICEIVQYLFIEQ